MSTTIHHIAAISGNLKSTTHFYRDFLGLRVLYKKTLFEGPKVCHFYWGFEMEQFITFYHCPGLGKVRPETQTIHAISLSAPNCAFRFWRQRIEAAGLSYSQQTDSVCHVPVLLLRDPDGLLIKLVFVENDCRSGMGNSGVPDGFAIKGFYAAEVSAVYTDNLALLLVEHFGLCCKQPNAFIRRYSSLDEPGSFIDVRSGHKTNNGFTGRGGVHHIALLMDDWQAAEKTISLLKASKESCIHRLQPNLFSSLYFREGDGILFELMGQVWPHIFSQTVSGSATKVSYVKKKSANSFSVSAA